MLISFERPTRPSDTQRINSWLFPFTNSAQVSVAADSLVTKKTHHIDDSTEPEWNAALDFLAPPSLAVILVEFWDLDVRTSVASSI